MPFATALLPIAVNCTPSGHSRPSRTATLVSLFRHGAGVRYCRRGNHAKMARNGEGAMIGVLNDFLLFSCLTAFVTGIVITAATLLI
jgi:hypothetical protein